ncbi:hypothetical protein [Dyadobacter sp. LHD-138]|uniref:hypothetical protein n=1 Tax=Dyadobacter sp. LHD-138 TaxID=3071413 RepID=UPI0027DFA308|nr:hypothetical protein [Dyadobacter sp. LHD-138]MDQ6479145.1 hypothetical protein [Dyadobacter sp. LHD-138]
MVAFDFDWSDPLNLMLILFLILLGGLQTWLLRSSFEADSRRVKPRLKIALNLLLWLVIAGFVLQPVLKTNVPSGNILVAGKGVPSAEISRVSDRLHVRAVFSVRSFKVRNTDTLTLLGQDFEPSFFARLSQVLPPSARVKWVPYFGDNEIQSISWKGVVRKGQLQRVRGLITSGSSQWLKLKFGNQTLDSTRLEKGMESFVLGFPVFTERRTAVDLVLGDEEKETIQFFAQPLPPLVFQFILNNPDFESRNLATWLANRGHAVELSTDLSKNIRSKLTLNKAGSPDVIITDPKNASEPQVKKALANGKSILFINLTNPPAEVASINASLGTKLQVKKISNEEVLPVAGELTKLPFEFGKSNAYLTIPKFPVAVEKSTGKVAVSLLNETFPTLLNGDSVAYSTIWTSVLAEIHPAYQTNIEVNAPVYKGIETTFRFNNLVDNPKEVMIGGDTLHVHYSAINGLTASAGYIPSDTAWLSLSQDNEIAVADSTDFNGYYKSQLVENFVGRRLKLQTELGGMQKSADLQSHVVNESRIPDWVWFLTLIFCFTALWLEPKFD